MSKIKLVILILGFLAIILLVFMFISYVFVPNWISRVISHNIKTLEPATSINSLNHLSSAKFLDTNYGLVSETKNTLQTDSKKPNTAISQGNKTQSSQNIWGRGNYDDQIKAYQI